MVAGWDGVSVVVNCAGAISEDGTQHEEVRLFYPDTVAIVRYRCRGAAIAWPWATKDRAG
jgi:hypothetical protein